MRYSSIKEGATATPAGQIFTVEYPDEKGLFRLWDDNGTRFGMPIAGTSPLIALELSMPEAMYLEGLKGFGFTGEEAEGFWIFEGAFLEHLACAPNGDVTHCGRRAEGRCYRATPENVQEFFDHA